MNKHTDILSIALASRGLMAAKFTCGCCGTDSCTADDHMDCAQPTKSMREAIIAEFSRYVCSDCANEMTRCEWTGRAVHPEHSKGAVWGGDGWFIDADALAEFEDDAAEECAHLRGAGTFSAGWV